MVSAKQVPLRLVGPGFVEAKADPLEGYGPQLLSTVELLDAYWPQVSGMLQTCVDRAMNGEMTVEDIYQGVHSGTLFALVIQRDMDVALVVIMGPASYPRLSVLSVVALAGRDFGAFHSSFFQHVCSWAYLNGVRHVEASASPATARVLKKFGFLPVYTTMRLALTEI